MFFLKHDWYHSDLWLLQDHLSSSDSLITGGESASDGYDIMANNQNPLLEYERHFHFWNLTVELCRLTCHSLSDIMNWPEVRCLMVCDTAGFGIDPIPSKYSASIGNTDIFKWLIINMIIFNKWLHRQIAES